MFIDRVKASPQSAHAFGTDQLHHRRMASEGAWKGQALGLNRFELLIGWGWFYFITKPMFKAIDYFFRWTGNFGLAILIVTVIIKLLFFPLANKSYASMAKMLQQAYIMNKHGTKVELWDNVMELFGKKKDDKNNKDKK